VAFTTRKVSEDVLGDETTKLLNTMSVVDATRCSSPNAIGYLQLSIMSTLLAAMVAIFSAV
jgi:hypothetical protein